MSVLSLASRTKSVTDWNAIGDSDITALTSIWKDLSDDPGGVLMDETLLIFPPNDIINLVWCQYGVARLSVRRPHIEKLYKGCMFFEYIVVPIDPASNRPALNIPPHLALCTRSGKMSKAWGALLPKIANPLRLSVIKRSKTADHDDRPPFTMKGLEVTHRTWSASDCVPPSFVMGHRTAERCSA
ncbi:hypothetical protein C8R47DRAFT_752150 [Mycena vitilis]|nr:hypothetical protein C8R47DRAFT_752150 [Mycena vitilis]